jgi:hypothetical protein
MPRGVGASLSHLEGGRGIEGEGGDSMDPGRGVLIPGVANDEVTLSV